MFIKKKGVELAYRTDGLLPEAVVRTHKFIGRSTYNSSDDLLGVVRGLRFVHGTTSYSGLPMEYMNFPSQLFRAGGVVVSVYARFDSVSAGSWQTVVCLGNGPFLATVSLGQEVQTNNMRFAIHNSPSEGSTITAVNAIIEGEMALWEAGVNSAGLGVDQEEWGFARKQNGILAAKRGGAHEHPVWVFQLVTGHSIERSSARRSRGP